ncbi:ribosome-releasing factor 2, mitochondrial isoform X2 [Hermetia illucens]|nr:ribosome-releasing factor 2, mitochondrial isoform X2 [Hermetia illucens]
MEVEQSLAAVDGVVVVLDGSAGVEAQTVTVWSQADRYFLPKIVFINKMDRSDADYTACLKDLKEKLDVRPLSLQLPIREEEELSGIIDVISMKEIRWKKESLGQIYSESPLPDEISDSVFQKRNDLIDTLCETDDSLAESVISESGYKHVTEKMIWSSVRKATCSQKAVPVLLGSAYKNVGIQTLMDGVCSYLPAPHERNKLYDCFEDNFAGKVFKIVHDKQRGPLSLVRVMRGTMKKGMRLVTMRGAAETLQRIYEPLADEYRETDQVQCGEIGVCAGLKNTMTGDLLTNNAGAPRTAQKKLAKILNVDKTQNNDEDNLDLINEVLSLEPKVPDAVYLCSIEPPSLAYQNALEVALKQLQREDPSLRVQYDETTGQTVLGGMGELHMDIIKSRLMSEYKIDADLGPLQIAYKETIDSECSGTWSLEKEIAGAKQQVSITLMLTKNSKELFRLDNSPENMPNLNLIRPKTLQIIKKGALAGLERGPRVGGKVVETQVKLQNLTIGRGTADSFILAAASQCVHKVLSENGTRLLEPIMAVQIIVPSHKSPRIISDLGRRRACINDVRSKGDRNKIIECSVPLSEMTGYSSILRTISSGTASMTMQPCGYATMNPQDEVVAERKAQGLE